MINRAYSIYDRKALVYSSPFFALNDNVACRTCADAVADPNTNLGRHPGDYVLYLVGYFDDHNGSLVPVEPLIHVADLLSLVPATTAPFPFNDHQQA